MNRKKEPLYRKVNTKTRYVRHNHSSHFRDFRNSDNSIKQKMVKGVNRGLDYTPLFKFLLSKVGKSWDDVYSEAKSRLPDDEAIFYMVFPPSEIDLDNLNFTEEDGDFRFSESTYFSKLYVDKDGLLQKVDPSLNETSFIPCCPCCTHTFNGVVFTSKYK